jgi:4-amino-4-deoxy-L-arabinose transferase-like glycosyltransferase
MPFDNPSPFGAFGLMLRIVAQLGVPVLLGLGGWWLAGRLAVGAAWGERLLAALLLTLAGGTLSTLLLGGVGLIHPVTLVIVAALQAGVAYRFRVTGDEPAPPLLPDLPWSGRLALVVLAVLATPYLWRALTEVMVDWDGLNYHAYKVGRWVQEGRLVRVEAPNPNDWTASYPGGHEAFVVQLTGVLRNELWAKLLNLPILGGLVIALASIGRRLRLSSGAALTGALVAVTTPAMFSWLATSYVDHLLALGVVAGLAFALRAVTAPGRALAWGDLILAGVALGLGVGAKYSALPMVLLIAVAVGLAALLRGRRLGAATDLALFCTPIVLVGGGWYLWNWVVTGNPVWPVPFGPFAGAQDPLRPWEGSSILGSLPRIWNDWSLYYAITGVSPEGWNLLGLGRKWNALLWTSAVGIVGLLLGVLHGLWRRRTDAAARGLLLLGALTMLLTWLRLPYFHQAGALITNTRFAMPGLCLAAVGAAALAHWLRLPGWLLCLAAIAAMGVDATVLDLRIPGLPTTWTWGLLGALALIGAVLALLRWRPPVPPRLAWGALGLVLLLGSWPLLSWREAHRLDQYGHRWEAHSTGLPSFVRCIRAVRDIRPEGAVALTAHSFPSYYYPFLEPFWTRRVLYVPGRPGLPGNGYEGGYPPLEPFDRGLWQANLEREGVTALVVSRIEASMPWADEARFAREMGWKLTHADGICQVFSPPEG